MLDQVTEDSAEQDVLDDLLYADEEKLRHEIMYQRQRISNLEGFKKMFFTLKPKLDAEIAKNSQTTTDGSQPPTSDEVTTRINQLEENLKGANEMAMLSMVTIGEYGSVLNFCKATATTESYDELVELIYECMNAYNLKTSIQIRGIDGTSMHYQDDSLEEEDLELINSLKREGRIIEQEDVIIFNHKYISLCVRNFPVDDEEKNGRLKDYLAIAASSADNGIKMIDSDVKLARQYQNLHTILKAVPQMIEKIQQGINNQNDKALNIYNNFVGNMDDMIKKQGLTNECSTLLQSLSSSRKEEFKQTFSQSSKLTDNLVHMIKQLEETYVDNESDVDIRDEIELPGANNEEKNKQNESPLDF